MFACSAAKSSTVPSHSPKKALFQLPSKDPGCASQGTAGLQRLPKFPSADFKRPSHPCRKPKNGQTAKRSSCVLVRNDIQVQMADGRWHPWMLMAHFGHLRPPKFWEIANCHLGTFPTNTNEKPCIGGNGVKDNSEAKACSI